MASKVHRLVLAVAQLVDAAVCYSFPPPAEEGKLIGVWDELCMGAEQTPGWLGRPLGPPVRLAKQSCDLLKGQGEVMSRALLHGFTGENVRFALLKGELRVSAAKSEQRDLRFRLRGVPCAGPDLFASITMRAEPMAGYPSGMARLCWVGIPEPQGKLVTADLPYVGMCLRGQKEVPASPEAGAVVRYRPKWSLRGERHDCYLVHPPYRGGTGYTFWQRDVQVPKDGRIEFFLGMGERAPGRSDGVTFRALAAEIRNGKAGRYVQLFEADQIESRWTAHGVSLGRWSGNTLRLRFVSDCGQKDNATTDHSLWGDVRVVSPHVASDGTQPVRFMTWVNQKRFTSGFYFSQIESRTIDLEFRIEGLEPVWISKLTVHAHPDAIYREFENGVALVNPGRRSYVFDLDALFPGQAFRRIKGSPLQDPKTNDGSPVRGSVTLQDRDGLFLVRMTH